MAGSSRPCHHRFRKDRMADRRSSAVVVRNADAAEAAAAAVAAVANTRVVVAHAVRMAMGRLVAQPGLSVLRSDGQRYSRRPSSAYQARQFANLRLRPYLWQPRVFHSLQRTGR